LSILEISIDARPNFKASIRGNVSDMVGISDGSSFRKERPGVQVFLDGRFRRTADWILRGEGSYPGRVPDTLCPPGFVAIFFLSTFGACTPKVAGTADIFSEAIPR
jgi:hypothetical protein